MGDEEVAEALHIEDDGVDVIEGVSTSTGKAAAGGVFSDHLGHFISAYNKDLGFSSVPYAELWGICHGLHLAWSQGFESILVQTDNSEAYYLLFYASMGFPFWQVRKISSLFCQSWHVNFSLIKREAKRAADFMAKSTIRHDDLGSLQYPTERARFHPSTKHSWPSFFKASLMYFLFSFCFI
ncbi:hypothetical protein F3Y22_tig00110108pilonHSYRG00052 [Hibiscus syriacus]|uniref:RNase H type-1 domain-containing protein n=1 Tax=Hibiscus syriacus TaxID=106335 RepID=A0A6A3BN60_HIBSY|nr:hypothetical protein F3Y22_tig00110108pilonHSYRG00052 [Hibiscus syriacus]